ncbi:MAG: type II secretion system protein [Candidatus Paceibacterota bacterium]|jgi:prepilin-type N-terminal cleavage/methylation domain-containing protein
MKNTKNSKRAFTLIELLVVIAIISLLTGIMITNITASRSKARDGKRISDLGQIQLAINLYYDRCKQFPIATGGGEVTSDATNCTGNSGNLKDYISTIPKPPSSPLTSQTKYDYYVNSNNTDYMLHIQLENSNELVRDGMQSPASFASGATCDSTVNYCLGPR